VTSLGLGDPFVSLLIAWTSLNRIFVIASSDGEIPSSSLRYVKNLRVTSGLGISS